MRTNIALSNLFQNKSKTALSVGGICVAITLVFMQMGFRGAVENTATVIYSKLDFDLLVRSPDYLHFNLPGEIPRSVLHEIAGQKSVISVAPLHTSMAQWDNPHEKKTRPVLVIGIDPDALTFNPKANSVHRDLDKLTDPSFILIDQMSVSELGPVNKKRFSPQDVGVTTTVSSKRVRIVGLFEMGSGLTANGGLITSEQGFDRLLPFDSKNNVAMGLIKLDDHLSRAETLQTARQLENLFRTVDRQLQVEVLTNDEVMRREIDRWLGETPMGFIFSLGVFVSLIVGAMIVYMVLSTDVAKRLNEYATLRAMGYANLHLSFVVLKQAAYLSVLAFFSSFLVALILYHLASEAAQIPIYMTIGRAVFVLVLSVMMSGVSGVLALRKLWQADPADLF